MTSLKKLIFDTPPVWPTHMREMETPFYINVYDSSLDFRFLQQSWQICTNYQ